MSFLVGPISGALAAGGVYYGFSNLIHSRTQQHQKDLKALSVRLLATPTLVPAPPSAASRIVHRPLISQIHAQWNEQVSSAYAWLKDSNKTLDKWRRQLTGDTKS